MSSPALVEATVEWVASQSETTKPSKPNWWSSTAHGDRVLARVGAVDAVIRAHHRTRPAPTNRRLVLRGVDLLQGPLAPDPKESVIRLVSWLLAMKCLTVAITCCGLDALHDRGGELARQQRVLARVLPVAPIHGHAVSLDPRRQLHVDPFAERLLSQRRAELVLQGWIPARRLGDRGREGGRAGLLIADSGAGVVEDEAQGRRVAGWPGSSPRLRSGSCRVGTDGPWRSCRSGSSPPPASARGCPGSGCEPSRGSAGSPRGPGWGSARLRAAARAQSRARRTARNREGGETRPASYPRRDQRRRWFRAGPWCTGDSGVPMAWGAGRDRGRRDRRQQLGGLAVLRGIRTTFHASPSFSRPVITQPARSIARARGASYRGTPRWGMRDGCCATTRRTR